MGSVMGAYWGEDAALEWGQEVWVTASELAKGAATAVR